jgi:hypothetical protein
MPPKSGVLIKCLVPIKDIISTASFPGDIDLLIIPYENESIILSKTLAIELKAVRASFSKQGKSPNDIGFSQANALTSLGFPYVAIGHLIISDKSPREAWREMMTTRIKDEKTGLCEKLQYTFIDMLPADLIQRSHGRLNKRCKDSSIGYFSAYISNDNERWFPEGGSARWNKRASKNLLDSIYQYYQSNFNFFFDTPRHE